MNIAILTGNLGSDPERRTDNMVTASLATSYKDQTEWHQIQFWDKTAEIAEKFLAKGQKITVRGRIQYRKSDKGERFTNIVVQELELPGRPADPQPDF